MKPNSPKFSHDSVRNYLLEIARIPLLTGEQEISYGKQVQQMVILHKERESLTQQLGHEPTTEEWARSTSLREDELTSLLKKGHRAKHRMVEANLRLVVSVAKKYQKCNIELLDLIQEGNIGLERGVEKFDPTRGYKLSTYVYWWIRQGITRAISDQGRSIRLPVHIHERLSKIRNTQKQLFHQMGRNATQQEIAQALDLEPAEVRKFLLLARQPVSLDRPLGENQETDLGDFLKDDGISPEDYTLNEAFRNDMLSLLVELTPRQQEVMKLRFGLDDVEAQSLQEIGDRFGISRERVRQIETQALACLRRHRAKVREYLMY